MNFIAVTTNKQLLEANSSNEFLKFKLMLTLPKSSRYLSQNQNYPLIFWPWNLFFLELNHCSLSPKNEFRNSLDLFMILLSHAVELNNWNNTRFQRCILKLISTRWHSVSIQYGHRKSVNHSAISEYLSKNLSKPWSHPGPRSKVLHIIV